MAKKFKIVVCVTGSGKNLRAILSAMRDGDIGKNVKIAGVIAMKEGIKAIDVAKENKLEVQILAEKSFDLLADYEITFMQTLQELNPDLLVMASSSMKLPKMIQKGWYKPIINVHPSLIPAFWSDDLRDLKVHKAVLERGVKLTGATVYVDNGAKNVPIIGQLGVRVYPGDTPENLRLRVMENADSKLLPWTINKFACGEITYQNGTLRITTPCPF